MRKLILGIVLSIGIALPSFVLHAKTNLSQNISQNTREEGIFNQNKEQHNQAQLAQMLAPIALYPDSLLTHILIASTYPIEVVEADRWITKNKKSPANKIARKLENKDWEPSIKALIMFPKVLAKLSEDLSWTQQLGDAFLQNEGSVLQTIQDLRYQAEVAGSLDKMENVKVERDENIIIIQPVQKEVIYVPYYDTRQVYGSWHWAKNPPVYWDWGNQISYSQYRPFAWRNGIHISWNYFFSDFHWRNRHVVVVNHRNTRYYNPKKRIVRSGYANRWKHKPHHRRGVSYSTNQVNKRYNYNRPVVHKTVNRQHNTPRLYSHNKDYRKNNHQNKLKGNHINNPELNKSKLNKSNLSKPMAKYKGDRHWKKQGNDINSKFTKHEALQKKIKKRQILPNHKSVTTQGVNQVNTVRTHAASANTTRNLSNHKNVRQGSEHRKVHEQRKMTKQHKINSKKAQIARKQSSVQHRTQQPVFKHPKTVRRQPTVQTRSKPNRQQRSDTRRSHSGGKRAEPR